jgi:predicted dehydrogenase
MARTRLIVIGVAGAGEWWVRGVAGASDVCTPVALVDVVPEHLARAVAANGLQGLPTFTHHAEALEAVPADGIVLVVPNHLHASIASAALERGLHVLSEKPLASTMEEARALLTLSQARGMVYVVSQNYRWTPQVAALRAALAAGAAGDLSYITYRFARNVALRGWRTAIPEILLEDMSLHHFDLLRHLTGREARRVIARTFRPPWAEVEGRPCAHVLMEFEGALEVAYTGSWAPREAETSWHGDAWFAGARGAIHFDGEGMPLLHVPGGSVTALPEAPLEHPGPPHALRAFCRAVQEGGEPECSIVDNIKSLALVHAAMASALRGGQPIDPRDV